MQALTSFFTAFCTGCILIGVLYIICPDGNIGKSVKYAFSLVFLIIIISAANITVKKVDFNFPNIQTNLDTQENMQIASAEYIYSYTLRKANINFSKITVCTDKTADDSIVINKVVIFSNEEKSKIIKALDVLAKVREVEIVNE